jgi:hypothetical protein
MKMTVGIVQFKKDLLNTIEAIRKIYGGEHMIYLESDSGKMVFRGKARDFENECLAGVGGELVRMAVAPFISTFNE